MNILGIGGSDHDVSSALIMNDKLICAIEEERLTRKKYGFYSNLLLGTSRKCVLKEANIDLDEVDLIVCDDILAQTALFGISRKDVKRVNHHMLHASSAFYPSDFEESAILVVDGAGSLVEQNGTSGLECISYGFGQSNNINIFNKVIGEKYHVSNLGYKQPYQTGDPENSLGYFYRLISHYIGFNYIDKNGFYFTEDGKTMGLAPYGTKKYYKVLREFIDFGKDGQIKIDLCSGEFEKVLQRIINNNDSNVKADLACAGQEILEEALIYISNYLYKETKCKNLCIAGGVGLNSVANGKILKNTNFENLFIQPASGDSGTSLGAALWGYYNCANIDKSNSIKKKVIINNTFLGPQYSNKEIENVLEEHSENILVEQYDDIAKKAAELIHKGKIVAVFNGKSEFGPRALGHRSILANPMLPEMKDILNERVKHREMFRPFAPAVLYEHQEYFFDVSQYSPYMLIVANVKKNKQSIIPSVVHVDGTARFQSVKKKENEFFYEIINEFYKITGVPVILNTSFNVKGEPIVETPIDAINCFKNTNIDYLVINNYLLSKSI